MAHAAITSPFGGKYLDAKTAALGAEVAGLAPDRIVGVVRGVEDGRVSAVAFRLARLIFSNL
jgi:hypothetical protein